MGRKTLLIYVDLMFSETWVEPTKNITKARNNKENVTTMELIIVIITNFSFLSESMNSSNGRPWSNFGISDKSQHVNLPHHHVSNNTGVIRIFLGCKWFKSENLFFLESFYIYYLGVFTVFKNGRKTFPQNKI